MSETLIPLSKPLTEEAMNQIQSFRERFLELWDNWESLKKLGIKLGGSFQNKGNGQVDGPSCGVEHHRLKGYYLDFRFFHAQKEPTHYFKVSNLIKFHCEDPRLRKCLDIDRESWHSAGVLTDWHGFTAESLISSLFNGKVFHNAQDVKPTLNDLRLAMSDDLANHELTFCIYNRMLVIRNLNWVMMPLSLENQFIRIPERHA